MSDAVEQRLREIEDRAASMRPGEAMFDMTALVELVRTFNTKQDCDRVREMARAALAKFTEGR